MKKTIRDFNTSGPNIRAQHYTLERGTLINKGVSFVRKNRYFTIWAPRQTGKSTSFRLMAEQLEKEGYKVCHINFENYRNHDVSDFLTHFRRYLFENWGISFEGLSIAGIFSKIETVRNERLVLIIDEVEGINPAYFGDLLHAIRNVYHFREKYALKSVILVGVSNITGVVEDNASPFNISDSLQIDFFTKEEVFELFEQYEAESGQVIETVVKQRIYEITAGQPGLVNGFGHQIMELFGDKPVVDYVDYLQIEEWYLYKAIDKNISNVINKAKTHQKFLEELLFLERKVRFDIDKEQIRYFHTNGLIKYDGNNNIMFWVPLYKKRLQKYFYPQMNGEAEQIQADIWIDAYQTANGQLDIDKIIRGYQTYAQKRGFRYFIQYDDDGNPKGLREAALVYSFETYIQSFLEVFKGKSYLEPHVNLGRSDLIINMLNSELVIEAKIFSHAAQFADGKTQLAYYIKSLNLTHGIYLVFVNKEVNNPVILEKEEVIDGVTLTTYIVRYDVEIDFSEPRKPVRRKKKA
jgi:AAA-like domain